MHVEIVTPDTTLFDEKDIYLVQLPGIDGSFEILNQHAPLVSVLKQGKIKVEKKKGEKPEFFEVKGGVIEVLNDHVIILAE